MKIRVLGFCGLVSALITASATYTGNVYSVGVAGCVMLVGNLYALFGKE